MMRAVTYAGISRGEWVKKRKF